MGPTETGTRPLERLRFGCGVGVLVIGPLFSDPGMQSGAVDGDLTGDNDSADHLAFAFAAGLRCALRGHHLVGSKSVTRSSDVSS